MYNARSYELPIYIRHILISGPISVGPRFASFLGGKEVTISGPCFDDNDMNEQVICDFGGTRVPGTVENQRLAKCVAPFSGSLGKVDLTVSLDGGTTFPYSGKFTYGRQLKLLYSLMPL